MGNEAGGVTVASKRFEMIRPYYHFSYHFFLCKGSIEYT
jgi:hypothetical protein